MKYSLKQWRVFTVIAATVLVVFILFNSVANTYAGQIHSFLGTSPYKQLDGASSDDAQYPLDYTDPARLRDDFNKVCEDVEGEGLVLLRNDNYFLPLASNSKVSLFLDGSVNFNCSEQGERKDTDNDKYPSLKDALESKRVGNVQVNPALWDFYKTGAASSYGGYKKVDNAHNVQVYNINEAPWELYDNALKNTFVNYGDAAIVVVTRDSNEGTDLNAAYSDGKDGNYLALSAEERRVLTELTVLKQQSVISGIVVLLNSAAQIQLDFLFDADISVDACMWVGNVGSSGIYAVADALVGNINPSGRLSDVYAKDNFSSPAMASWVLNDGKSFASKYDKNGYSLTTTQENYGVYVEGIYSGYRYYETRYADVVAGRNGVGDYNYTNDVAYTFGTGLSYSDFVYGDINVATNDTQFVVTVDVTNVGDMLGKEVVQVYAQKPYTDYAVTNNMEVAAVELVGFAKTAELKPGQTETVTITVEKSQLTSYDAYGAQTYILDQGNYFLAVGCNAHDALNNILAKQGYSVRDGMDYDGNASLVYDGFVVAQRDTITYATSAETGKSIANRLDHADMNRYVGRGSNQVTYVSRNNWVGTFPSEPIQFVVTEQMYNDLQSNKPVESSGEMPLFGQDNGLVLKQLQGVDKYPYQHEQWQKLLDQMTFDEMNRLVSLGLATTEFIESVQKPATNGTDSPTAIRPSANNLTNVRFPCEGIWASTFNTELVNKVGQYLADDAISAKADALWIPGLNMHRTPYGGRCHEYFSEDPYLTGKMAEAEIKGVQSKGVIAYPKHYAFNDAEAKRSGICIWLNEQCAREIMLAPWKYATSAKRGNAHAMMSSFNRVGCVWTSADKGLMTDILRDEFGFEGFVITDMASGNGAQYMTSLDGIMAGTNIWFSASLSDCNFEPYKDNPTVVAKLRESCHLILYNICNFSVAMDGWSSGVTVTVWWQWLLISIVVFAAVATAFGMAMYIVTYAKKARKK